MVSGKKVGKIILGLIGVIIMFFGLYFFGVSTMRRLKMN